MPTFCCVLFSYNRALQLDLTLRSLSEKMINPDIKYYVVYQCTPSHETSYQTLINEWAINGVVFKRCDNRARSFREIYKYLFHSGNLYRYLRKEPLRNRLDNFKDLVEQSIKESEAPFTFFSTDDQYLFRPTYIPEAALQCIRQDPENVSFRMGMTEHLTCKRRLPEKMKVNRIHYEENGIEGNILEWDARDPAATKLWEYSFNVDFQVFDSTALLTFLSNILYHIPTTLEWAGLRVARKKNCFRKLLGTTEKTIIGTQLNLVQTLVNNAATDFSPETLKNLYEKGYRLIIKEDQINPTSWLFMPDKLFFYPMENPTHIMEFKELAAAFPDVGSIS